MAFKILDMFDKLDDIIYKPIELITDWAKEPLKRAEHKRAMQVKQMEQDNDIRKKQHEKELENIRHDNAIKEKLAEKEKDSELKMREKEHEINMRIKEETEIKRIISEIETLKQDKDFQRQKEISDAIIKYQQELTNINVEAIKAIGNMQLDLRERAQKMIYEKTLTYKELQKTAQEEARQELKQINEDFPNECFERTILSKAVELRLLNIISTAQNFLMELNKDISTLNTNIDKLTRSGQSLIETHLNRFGSINGNYMLQSKDTDYIEAEYKES